MAGLTPAQQNALKIDRNISVTAGAGSGKTRILVERFLAIIKNNPGLTRHTVAITFTEKAAGEMQERIAGEVNRRIAAAKNTRERQNYLDIRDRIGSAYITTIHGFCSRILREFPIEAGVPTDFAMLDEIRQKILMNNALQKLMDQIEDEKAGIPLEQLRSLFRHIPRRRVEDILREMLQAPFEMEQIREKYRDMTGESYLAFLEELWQQAFNAAIPQSAVKELYRQTQHILSVDNHATKNEKGAAVHEALQQFKNSYDQDPKHISTRAAFLRLARQLVKSSGDAYSSASYMGGKKSWNKFAADALTKASGFCSPLFETISRRIPASLPGTKDREWFNDLQTLLALYEQAHALYDDLKNEESALDFEDLQLKTMHLLQQYPPIRERLAERFRYIMVDEFQDTNPVQWEIVQLLARDARDRLSPDKVFVVGDPKQAIYGFRNADIRVFKKVKQLFAAQPNAGDATNIVFEESFRFVPELNRFINDLFRHILRESDSNPFEVGFDALRAMRKVDAPCLIELNTYDKDDKDLDEYEAIALRIQALLKDKVLCHQPQNDGSPEIPRALVPGDIAILLRSRTPLEKLEAALRRHKVPFKTVGGIGFWKQPEVYAIYHLLRFFVNPRDDLALTGVLRSRFFTVGDDILFFLQEEEGRCVLEKLHSDLSGPYPADERKHLRTLCDMLDKWLALRERISLGELLEIVVEETRLQAVLAAEFGAEQRQGNLRKLINLATSFELGNTGGMRAFFAMIDDLIKRDVRESQAITDLDDAGTVKIMTIHASKGLQFPAVFLPGLNQARNDTHTILLDGEYGLALSQKDDDAKKQSNTLFDLLRIRNRQKESAEMKRLFYVGVSRASDHLFLYASTNSQKPKGMYKLLTEALDKAHISLEENQITGTETTGGVTASLPQLIDTLLETEPRQFDNADFQEPVKISSAGQTFSATSLMTFIKDPENYYKRYHLGFFEDDYIFYENHNGETENLSLLKGTLLHRYLELLPGFDDRESLMERILFENDVFDPETQELLRNDIRHLARILETSETGLRISRAKLFRNELSVTSSLNGNYITGKFDRLQQAPDGFWEVIDYKTNKIAPAALNRVFKDYGIQIEMYAVLLAGLYPDQPHYDVSLYFLNIDTLKTRRFLQDDITKLIQKFIQIIADIKRKFPIV